MPFCIYEYGFSRTRVSLDQGKRREETFIPWNRVDRISLDKNDEDENTTYHIKIEFDADKTYWIPQLKELDYFKILTILKTIVPNKCSKEMDEIVGDSLVLKPNPIWKPDLFLGPAYGILLGAVWLNLMISQTFETSQWELLFLPFVINAVLMSIVFSTVDKDEKRLIEICATCDEQGIILPKTLFARLSKTMREMVPWNEISIIRLKIDYRYFAHHGEIVTWSGEKFRVQLFSYKKLDEIDYFHKCGWDFINKNPTGTCSPIMIWSYPKLAAFYILLLSPLLLILL